MRNGPRPAGQDALAAVWLLLCIVMAGGILWYQDARYGRPTPRPLGLVDVAVGAPLPWPPALVHFFNPDCPCSRFNLDHVRTLVERHGEDLDVVLVVQSDRPDAARLSVPGLDLPTIHDTDGSLADLAGVYSTPVAVVLDREHGVLYVGNYTAARYCTDPSAEPVRIVIERLLGTEPDDGAPVARPIPFGCPLPSDAGEDAA